MKTQKQRHPSVTCVYMVVCENAAKGRVFVTDVHSGIPAVFGVCSLAYVLIGIQSALQADCIAGMASAAGSHGIQAPDPDSHHLYRYTAKSSFSALALAK